MIQLLSLVARPIHIILSKTLYSSLFQAMGIKCFCFSDYFNDLEIFWQRPPSSFQTFYAIGHIMIQPRFSFQCHCHKNWDCCFNIVISSTYEWEITVVINKKQTLWYFSKDYTYLLHESKEIEVHSLMPWQSLWD